jgi:hypothetical protein
MRLMTHFLMNFAGKAQYGFESQRLEREGQIG